jgi:DnaJ-class molecular chaperone
MDDEKQETQKPQIPPLEQEYDWCSGEGHDYGGKCDNCHGSGKVPTDFGSDVLALVKRNLFRD